jgi:hypothetical protein
MITLAGLGLIGLAAAMFLPRRPVATAAATAAEQPATL